jgi:hypothetical protein
MVKTDKPICEKPYHEMGMINRKNKRYLMVFSEYFIEQVMRFPTCFSKFTQPASS